MRSLSEGLTSQDLSEKYEQELQDRTRCPASFTSPAKWGVKGVGGLRSTKMHHQNRSILVTQSGLVKLIRVSALRTRICSFHAQTHPCQSQRHPSAGSIIILSESDGPCNTTMRPKKEFGQRFSDLQQLVYEVRIRQFKHPYFTGKTYGSRFLPEHQPIEDIKDTEMLHACTFTFRTLSLLG